MALCFFGDFGHVILTPAELDYMMLMIQNDFSMSIYIYIYICSFRYRSDYPQHDPVHEMFHKNKLHFYVESSLRGSGAVPCQAHATVTYHLASPSWMPAREFACLDMLDVL